jgi:5-carboxymethyl-2-hydroxymuconate isomerase
MVTARNFSMSGINSGHHNLPTFEMSMKSDNIEFVRIVVVILKMATARNFSMSGIYSGHHNLPTYETSLKSDNVEFVR